MALSVWSQSPALQGKGSPALPLGVVARASRATNSSSLEALALRLRGRSSRRSQQLARFRRKFKRFSTNSSSALRSSLPPRTSLCRSTTRPGARQAGARSDAAARQSTPRSVCAPATHGAQVKGQELALLLTEAEARERAAGAAVARMPQQACEEPRQAPTEQPADGRLFQVNWEASVFDDAGELSAEEQRRMALLKAALLEARAELTSRSDEAKGKLEAAKKLAAEQATRAAKKRRAASGAGVRAVEPDGTRAGPDASPRKDRQKEPWRRGASGGEGAGGGRSVGGSPPRRGSQAQQGRVRGRRGRRARQEEERR